MDVSGDCGDRGKVCLGLEHPGLFVNRFCLVVYRPNQITHLRIVNPAEFPFLLLSLLAPYFLLTFHVYLTLHNPVFDIDDVFIRFLVKHLPEGGFHLVFKSENRIQAPQQSF